MSRASKYILILTAILLISVAESNNFLAPDFCNGYECPGFSVVSTHENNIEIREYKDSFWVSTDLKGASQTDLRKKGFWTLFNYISGKNNRKEKISMTVPVLMKINPKTPFSDQDQVYSMSFYLGYKYHTETPPQPEESSVYINKISSRKFAIIYYSGYSNQKDQEENLRKLGNFLVQKNIGFSNEQYYYAGYDAPYKFWSRHNEIWVELL
jgi:hypothetical protein